VIVCGDAPQRCCRQVIARADVDPSFLGHRPLPAFPDALLDNASKQRPGSPNEFLISPRYQAAGFCVSGAGMPGQGQVTIEKLRGFLRDLKPGARALLISELERKMLSGDNPAGAEIVLAELRRSLREARPRRPALAIRRGVLPDTRAVSGR
jgi:hypothetical protein